MIVAAIQNDEEHAAAIEEIERLWESPADSPEGLRFVALVDAIVAYEAIRWPIPAPQPGDNREPL